MGSLAWAGSEARPGSERRRPAAGRRPVPSTGQNTVLPVHSGLRPPFTTEERIRSNPTVEPLWCDLGFCSRPVKRSCDEPPPKVRTY